jgi:hypothetical protein
MKTHASVPAGLVGLAFAAALATTGCSSAYKVKVDAVSRPVPVTAEIASYRLSTRGPAGPEDSLRSKEAVGHIRTALSGHGLYEAPDPAKADIVVEIDYGMAAPRVTYETTVVPVFAPVGRTRLGHEPALSDEKSDSLARKAAVAQPPQRELIGYEEISRPVVVHEKHLSISGRENKAPAEGRPPLEIFRVHASIENASKDLRGHLPVLASAAMEKIGRTTDGTVIATLHPGDDAIGFIRKGM